MMFRKTFTPLVLVALSLSHVAAHCFWDTESEGSTSEESSDTTSSGDATSETSGSDDSNHVHFLPGLVESSPELDSDDVIRDTIRHKSTRHYRQQLTESRKSGSVDP